MVYHFFLFYNHGLLYQILSATNPTTQSQKKKWRRPMALAWPAILITGIEQTT
jgi:hypothetical protein